MPYVETETSRQDIGFDGDGYIRFSRTFKVWGVNPQVFHKTLHTIYQNGSPPAQPVPLPGYGDKQEIDDPDPNLSALRPFLQSTEGGSAVQAGAIAILHDWILSPIDAVMFLATAHYSNDPHLTPHGAQYHAVQQQAMVTIPYARSMPIAFGTGAGSSIGYVEAAFQLPMTIESISHTVAVPVSYLPFIETAIASMTNHIHNLPTIGFAAFLGIDVRMRGVQWLDVTYNWQWQAGVKDLTPGAAAKFYGADGGAGATPILAPLLPGPIPPLNGLMGTGTASQMILPPYHTMEMMWCISPDTGTGAAAIPQWQYRMPYTLTAATKDEWKSLYGSSKFLWGGGTR